MVQIKVLTWNVLFDGYISNHYNKYNENVLNEANRKALFHAFLLKADADILCLQECQRDWLLEKPLSPKIDDEYVMQLEKETVLPDIAAIYDVYYFKRSGRNEGLAVLLRKEKINVPAWKLTEYIPCPFLLEGNAKEHTRGAVFLKLQHIKTNQRLLVATTHLTSNHDQALVEIQ